MSSYFQKLEKMSHDVLAFVGDKTDLPLNKNVTEIPVFTVSHQTAVPIMGQTGSGI